MFEYYGHTHVYIAPGAGADNPLGPKYFHEYKSSVHLLIPSKFFLTLNDIFLFFPLKCMVGLSWPCCKKGQGHPRVIIYTNFVELHCLMLHAKFQNHRPSCSGEEDF